jgi:hypothetical protein
MTAKLATARLAMHEARITMQWLAKYSKLTEQELAALNGFSCPYELCREIARAQTANPNEMPELAYLPFDDILC